MARTLSRLKSKADFRSWQPWFLSVPVVLVLMMVLRAALMPDAAASHFARAQRLRAAGQEQQALRLYDLIIQTQPRSSYAPLALEQEGEILTALARRSGEGRYFRDAIEVYQRLAAEYPSHSSAGEALLLAGSIAFNDLRDTTTATRCYEALMEKYSANAEYASEATLRLGRIALQKADAPNAQKLFAKVMKEYSRFPERAAEAQYHQGVVHETLLKNKAAARSAYEATIKNWPRSVWAGDAKERLGMMTYTDGSTPRPSRRVLIEIGSLPKASGDSRAAALRLILAARGMEISDAVWQGWSLAPFRAGFSAESPGRVLEASGDWETVAANAGLTISRRTERDTARALSLLRDELDAGRTVLIDNKGWVLVEGYDTSRDEFLTRREGTNQETLKTKQFADNWRSGGSYSLLSFNAPGQKSSVQISKPQSTPDAPPLLAPIYSHRLPRLSIRDAHRRALRNAASLMRRPRESGVLLNLEALRALQSELEVLSRAPVSPVPAPETSTSENSETPTDETTPAAQSTPAPAAPPAPNLSPRWKNLRKWFGAPRKAWVESRRDAAAFLDVAANDLGDAKLQRAAADFRASMSHLNEAASTLPAEDIFDSDPDTAREAIKVLLLQITQVLEAEKRATAAMG